MRSIAPVGTSIARPGIDAKAPRDKTKRNPRFRLRTFPITLPLPSGSFGSGFAFAQDDNVCVYVLSFRAQRGIPLPLQPSAFGVGSLALRPRDDRRFRVNPRATRAPKGYQDRPYVTRLCRRQAAKGRKSPLYDLTNFSPVSASSSSSPASPVPAGASNSATVIRLLFSKCISVLSPAEPVIVTASLSCE